jgi:hypothetical protein
MANVSVLIGTDKGLVDILGAILTPIIALLALYIAFMQWRTNDKRRRSEYFDRRIAVYEAIAHYLRDLLALGRIEQGADVKFLRDTTIVSFLFGKNIKALVDEIFQKSGELKSCQDVQDKLSGEDLRMNLAKQGETKEWLRQQLNTLPKKFSKYLRL